MWNLEQLEATGLHNHVKEESAPGGGQPPCALVPARLQLLTGTFLRSSALGPDLKQLELLLVPLTPVRILLGRAVRAGFTFGEQTFQRLFG